MRAGFVILIGADARLRWRWSPYFRPEEFTCRCPGDELLIESEFLDKLVELREAFERPMLITSGYRCADHNTRVSSTGPRGPHTTGSSADVGVFGVEAFDLARLAFLHGFTGIGINQRGEPAKRFVHLDTLPVGGLHHPRPRVWSY